MSSIHFVSSRLWNQQGGVFRWVSEGISPRLATARGLAPVRDDDLLPPDAAWAPREHAGVRKRRGKIVTYWAFRVGVLGLSLFALAILAQTKSATTAAAPTTSTTTSTAAPPTKTVTQTNTVTAPPKTTTVTTHHTDEHGRQNADGHHCDNSHHDDHDDHDEPRSGPRGGRRRRGGREQRTVLRIERSSRVGLGIDRRRRRRRRDLDFHPDSARPRRQFHRSDGTGPPGASGDGPPPPDEPPRA